MLIESGAESFYGVPIAVVMAAWGVAPRMTEETQPRPPEASSDDPPVNFPRR